MGANELEQLAADRFVMKDKLGAGGMGVVYRAFDKERGVDVALKTLRKFDGTALYRFKKEFRVLADLAHPNLVTLYELLTVGSEWFFTMELIDGVSFLEYVRPHGHLGIPDTPFSSGHATPDPTMTMQTMPTMASAVSGARASSRMRLRRGQVNPERLRAATLQLVSAIRALHDAGKLHRDIKPSNVLVTPEGRVVLCDFGLVADAAEEKRTVEVSAVGTPMYMSPEQASNESLSEASDWYSLGVMLYEALTGRAPFSGTFDEIIHRKRTLAPTPPQEVADSVPGELAQLCTELLAIDPSKRPAAAAIRAALGSSAVPAADRDDTGEVPHAPLFVGRERHLAALRTALADSRDNRSVAVFVHGKSGMGKSALVRHFLDHEAHDGGAVVLEGRCYERESVRYKGLDALVDALSSYLHALPHAEVEALIPKDIVPLARLFPVLRRIKAVAEPKERTFEPPDPQESRRRAFAALRILLANLARTRPIILHIDDLQWGDIDSAPFLNDLIHHHDVSGVLLLGSYRREDVDNSPLLAALNETKTAHTADVRDLPVDALSDEDARALVRDILPEADWVTDDVAASIIRESAGSPFFLAEIAYAMAQQGHATSIGLDEVVQTRVGRLPEEARALLIACAVAGRPVPVAVAARAANIGDDTAAVRRLRVDRLARTRQMAGRHEIEPYHDRIRETVVASLRGDSLRDMHARLMDALEQSDKSDLEALVEHAVGAGDRERAGRYAARAAVQAERALAFDRAARNFRRALELQELTGKKRRARQRRMADALANAGRLVDAARVYMEAADGAEPAESLELMRLAGEQLLYGGRLEEGKEVTRNVVESVGLKMPGTSRSALVSVAWRRLWIRLRGLGFEERAEADVPADTLKRLDVCWSTSSGLSFVDPMLGKAYQMRHLIDALNAGEPFRISLAFSLEMGYLALAGTKTRAQVLALYERNLALAKRVGLPHAVGMCQAVGGLSAFLAGRWRDALDLIAAGNQILRDECTGVRWELGLAQVFSMSSLLYLGEIGELTRMVPLLLRDALERGDLYAANSLRSWRTNVAWLAMDDPDEARRKAKEGALESARDAFHLHHYYELLTNAQIDLYRGAGPDAWQRVEQSWRPLEKSMLLRIQSVRIESAFLRARAALANAHAGNDAALMVKHAERMATQIAREKTIWGEPLATLIRAEVAGLAERTEDAAALFATAAAGFDAGDMALFAAIARRRRGQLIGGDTGAALVEAADLWMERQSIRSIERMAALYSIPRS